MSHVSRASRPGLTIGMLRILCNGMCAPSKFHTEGEEQKCRAGRQDEPDSLSHYNEQMSTFVRFFLDLATYSRSTTKKPSSSGSRLSSFFF